jgi:hypothetical protein
MVRGLVAGAVLGLTAGAVVAFLRLTGPVVVFRGLALTPSISGLLLGSIAGLLVGLILGFVGGAARVRG